MTIQEFINNVSDRIVDYLRDNKSQDMQEVRNIIALHFSDGLTQMFYDEDERIVRNMESLIKERDTIYKSSKRNSEINAELLNLSQQRKNIKKKAHETMDERDFVLLLQWLRKNHPDVLDAFHATQPKKKPFAKLK